MQNLPRAPQEFIDAMNANVRDAASGTEIINEPSGPRVASWTRLATFPILYSTSSQTVSAALAAWRLRTLGLGGVGVTAIVLFCLFAAKSARAARAEAEARFHAMALSEVHHRVKNSLTLVLAMVRLQRNQHKDPVVRAELDAVASRLLAVAETQSLLESARAADKIDPGQLLARLADEMSAQSGKTVRFASSCVAPIDNSVAASLAIIANELITNGLKHGRSTVDVNLASDAGGISLTVSSDGDALPEGFTIEGTDGFGLRMVKSVAEHSGGAFRVGNDAGRATFEVRLAAAG
jgi:two-component sensor histidine kinase